MPRNRTVRVAVLGSSVQRAADLRYPSRSNTALRRRVAVGLLVVLSLALMSVYFRESEDGPLHGIQSAGATVLRPFQIGAERVASPFRDAYAYVTGLVGAKAENERLQRELVQLRLQLTQNQVDRDELRSLKGLLGYRAWPRFPADYRLVAAEVVTYGDAFGEYVVIAAGKTAGVQRDDAVVNGKGLVGRVTRVTNYTARVTLLTDAVSRVSAMDVDPRSRARGMIVGRQPGSDSLVLDRVSKDENVRRGDEIVTAGSQGSRFTSLYPFGIPIGVVRYVNQTDTDTFKRIQVEPYVDFDDLDSVFVLVPKERRT